MQRAVVEDDRDHAHHEGYGGPSGRLIVRFAGRISKVRPARKKNAREDPCGRSTCALRRFNAPRVLDEFLDSRFAVQVAGCGTHLAALGRVWDQMQVGMRGKAALYSELRRDDGSYPAA